LFNITLTPTLKAEIIAAQEDDEGMGHIRRRMQKNVTQRLLVSVRMRKGPYVSRKD
jgi:hypothetical protein